MLPERNILIFLGLIVVAGTIAVLSFEAESTIPPTPAIATINDTKNLNNITMTKYNDELFLTAGQNMTLTFFPVNNTIRFESADTGGSGGDNLGDHTATQTLDMNGYDIHLDSGNKIEFNTVGTQYLERQANNRFDFTVVNGDVLRLSEGFIEFLDYSQPVTLELDRQETLSAGEVIANVDYMSHDSGGADQRYVRIRSIAADETSGTEDGRFVFNSIIGGTFTDLFDFNNGADTNHARFLIDTRFEQDVEIESNDLIIGGNDGSNGDSTLVIYNNNPPTSSVTDGIILYSDDVSASAELHVRDEAGNISVLSPHDCFLNIERKSSTDWFFCSENPYIGKGVAISYYEVIRALEEVTGKTLIHEYNLPIEKIRDWDNDQLLLKQIHDKNRNDLIQWGNDLNNYIQNLQNKQPLEQAEQELLSEYQKELSELIIPGEYTIKPRPTYFDMIEVSSKP